MSETTGESGGVPVSLVTKACDMCRKKKIRCEPSAHGSCVQCIKHKTRCHFTPIAVKRRPRRPAGHKRVEQLEQRLKRMEEQLLRATQISREVRDSEVRDQNHLVNSITAQKNLGFSHSADPIRQEGWLTGLTESSEAADEVTLSLPETGNFDQMYPFSATPAPMSNLQMMGISSSPWKRDHIISNLFTRRVFQPLPPKDVALSLIEKSFAGFNYVFPIWDRNAFLDNFHDSEMHLHNPGWWASLNMVLALAHRFRAQRDENSDREDTEAWGWLQNAMSVITELTMMAPSLEAVQALLAMAIIVQGTPNPAPCASLTSTAVKQAQHLGLHRKIRPGHSAPKDAEQRKKIFWIAYFLDKDISLRTGMPPNQEDDEMDIESPVSSHSLGKAQDCHSNFFALRIGLARIQSGIYKRLYSPSAASQPGSIRLLAAQSLYAQLAAWKEMVPIDWRQEDFGTRIVELPYEDPVLHSVIFRLTYFETLNKIYTAAEIDWPGMPRHPGHTAGMGTAGIGIGDVGKRVEGNGDGVDGGNSHMIPPPVTCVPEARKAIRLLSVTPKGDYACIWVVLHIFVSATTTLLEHIVDHPAHPLAPSDLKLIEPLLRLLGILSRDGKSEDVASMYISCAALFDKASLCIQTHSDRLLHSSMDVDRSFGLMGVRAPGGKTAEKESVEEFIRRIEGYSAGIDEEFGTRAEDFELVDESGGGFAQTGGVLTEFKLRL